VTSRPWDAQDSQKLSPSERKQLEQVLKRREREADEAAAEVKAERLANFEEELATIFSAEDETFRDLVVYVEELVAKANAEVDRRCDELGIRRAFRPRLRVGWFGRGENADKERRAELRKAAGARAESDMLKAKKQIRHTFTDALEMLAIGALNSDEARAFLAQAPRPEVLMPPVRLADLDVAKAKLQVGYRSSVPLLAIAAGDEDPSDPEDDDFPRSLR
jgi:hypothetical protein